MRIVTCSVVKKIKYKPCYNQIFRFSLPLKMDPSSDDKDVKRIGNQNNKSALPPLVVK